jgi:oxygen-independent coproporphyrinogen-3 oxidase
MVSHDREEPLEGNYFVSTYPPFSTWKPQHVGGVHDTLQSPPPSSGDALFGLYVHIPFCLERCEYCYYLSYADKSDECMDGYVDALADELAIYARTPALLQRKLSFVYFGGGTPSLLSTRRLEGLMRKLQASFTWARTQEVTFECAPLSVTEPKLRAIRDAGVTRISLGMQQLDDGILRKNGRVHLVRDAERAYAAVRRVGFDLVNIDLIVGLIGDTDRSFLTSLDRVIGMEPESVTIYQLEIPLNTPLYRALRDGTLDTPPDAWNVKRARLARGFARLEQAGYSVRSAYAAVRDPRRHAFVYQSAQYHGADLLGIGVASFSYVSGVHWQNVDSFDQYLSRVREGQLPLGRAYVLTEEERMIREFVLQLKLGAVDAAYFRDKFGVEIAQRFAGPLGRLVEAGWLTLDDQGITLTRDGLIRVDHFLSDFYLPQHRAVRHT